MYVYDFKINFSINYLLQFQKSPTTIGKLRESEERGRLKETTQAFAKALPEFSRLLQLHQ